MVAFFRKFMDQEDRSNSGTFAFVNLYLQFTLYTRRGFLPASTLWRERKGKRGDSGQLRWTVNSLLVHYHNAR